jgi:hypothetical protein
MSDNTKFEQLLDLLVNEEKDKAESLFHDIVVEKSKEIYQGLIESDESEKEDEVEETSEKDEDAVEEATDTEEEKTDESFDDESVEEVGGDAADDMVSDVEAPDAEGDMDFDGDGEMDDHEDSHDDIEDRVVDLEDALDELKAEFEEMMGDKEGGEGEEEMPAADEEESEEAEEEAIQSPFEATEEDGEEVEEGAKREKSVGETMREYVEKVSAPNNSEGADNTASPVASKGGKDSGADGKNIAQSGEEKGGSAVKAKDMGKSFENEPGSKAGDTFKKASAPKSAE